MKMYFRTRVSSSVEAPVATEYEAVIGIETHVQLTTKSKVDGHPNSCVSAFCCILLYLDAVRPFFQNTKKVQRYCFLFFSSQIQFLNS